MEEDGIFLQYLLTEPGQTPGDKDPLNWVPLEFLTPRLIQISPQQLLRNRFSYSVTVLRIIFAFESLLL